MKTLVVLIYEFFSRRRWFLYTLLTFNIALMLYFLLGIKLNEDVNSFFPVEKGGFTIAEVIQNLKMKDKIFVMVSSRDTSSNLPDPDEMIRAMTDFINNIQEGKGREYIKHVALSIDSNALSSAVDYIYNRLPFFLEEQDYIRLDSLLTEQGLSSRMITNYQSLVSPAGFAIRDVIMRDPLGIGLKRLSGLQNLSSAGRYSIYDGYIFSEDMSTLLVTIEPTFGTGSTGKNEALAEIIENAQSKFMAEEKNLRLDYFGGPVIAVANARQLKKDTIYSLTTVIIAIVIFVSLAFRNKWAVFLILAPVIYGLLFGLALIAVFKGSISAIAIGAGSAIIGIAMSYSIHVLSHRSHVKSIRQLLDELTYPLTIGSFTTIGAFLGLMFTNSALLQDFGLFAALAMIGTTLFCLFFLPHFLSKEKPASSGKVLSWVERISRYPYESNKWLVGSIILLIGVTLFYYNDVRFDSDMMHLNYEPKELKQAEDRMQALFLDKDRSVFVVTAVRSSDSLADGYRKTSKVLSQLKREGEIKRFVTLTDYLISEKEQHQRLLRWQSFWGKYRPGEIQKMITAAAIKQGFKPESFSQAELIWTKQYAIQPVCIDSLAKIPLFKEWFTGGDSVIMALSQMTPIKEKRDTVYSRIAKEGGALVIDRRFFADRMAGLVKDDFNLVLFISSILIFAALLISYGRIELALLAFLPMALSWVIILGLMSILGIEFNIVNIILSTFIFGIGDDFSIFIMDGLLIEYRSRRSMLGSHKTAIFFSVFTVLLGMGALVFSKHPALQSLSVISLLGILSVILVGFTIQPLLFKMLISNPVRKGNFPNSMVGIIRSIYCNGLFLLGCVVLQVVILILLIIPVSQKRKKLWFHYAVHRSTRLFLIASFMINQKRRNEFNETFKKPAVVIANHQSVIDILVLLSIVPKGLMVTNGWVWNSPFFGRIVRYADFYHTADGYESLADTLEDRVKEGYSVIVFPEGTRSTDLSVGRFHKGAFYLAERLNLDIIPIVIYGNGMVSSKRQPLYIKLGTIVSEVLERISPENVKFGNGYKERSKGLNHYFREQLTRLNLEFGNPDNRWFKYALMRNYIYKGPVLEWYMRVKTRMEDDYRFYNSVIPRDAVVTDLGCGYGPLSFMLKLTSPDRDILGIDYDEEKIDIASNSWQKGHGLTFSCADITVIGLRSSDVFVINDVLHYLPSEKQLELLEACYHSLRPGGMLIIRDGDVNNQKHLITRMTEFLSVKVFRFNKSEANLSFFGSSKIESFAQQYKLKLESWGNDTWTSNTNFVLKK